MNFSITFILLASIVGSAMLIYVPYILVAYGRAKVGYDLSAPRAMFDQLPPYAKRATWAHENSFETFMIYSVAALMAVQTEVTSEVAIYSAIGFCVARFLFSLFYILDVPPLRSIMFGVGSACTYTLFILSLMKVIN